MKLRSTIRYLLLVVVPCLLFWLEYSLAFVAGVTASTISVLNGDGGKDNHTTTTAAAATATAATTVVAPPHPSNPAAAAARGIGELSAEENDDTTNSNGKQQQQEQQQQQRPDDDDPALLATQWDTTSATHAQGSGTASYFSTMFSSSLQSNVGDDDDAGELPEEEAEKGEFSKRRRLIDWNTNNLLTFLEKIMSSRASREPPPSGEVLVAIAQQTKQFVTQIADLYDSRNPYHNFEHATHVGKSLRQLLLSPGGGKVLEDGSNPMKTITDDPLLSFSLVFAAMIHDVQHRGVPNTQLSIEQPNLASKYDNQSIAERNSIDIGLKLLLDDPAFQELKNAILGTTTYTTASPSYSSIRKRPTNRFEYFVARAVLATDIADATLRADRQRRWDAVFINNNNREGGGGGDATTEEDLTVVFEEEEDDKEQSYTYTYTPKTIIAMEHLMQVVDVAHTFQSSPINHVWNERLFAELKQAYRARRVTPQQDIDPLQGWYQNEINFFDYYVIPLAKKWEQCCGCNIVAVVVNNVCGDENSGSGTAPEEKEEEEQDHDEDELMLLFPTKISFLEQATRNRQEWITIGHGVVEEFKEKY